MRRFIMGGAVLGLVAIVACTDNSANSLQPLGSPTYGVSHVVAGANVPQGTATFLNRLAAGALDSIRATFNGLDSLDGSYRYVTWIGDSAGTFKRAPGYVITTRTDTVLNSAGEPTIIKKVDTLGVTSVLQGKGPRTSYQYITSRAVAGFATTDAFQTFLISIEANPTTATVPNVDRRILFARRATDIASTTARTTAGNVAVTDNNARLRFGNYNPNLALQYIFITSGRGRIYIRDNVLQISDSSLSRPPKGYFYGVYGVKRNAQNAPIDTVYFGPLHSPYPNRATSLREADSLIVDAAVQPLTPQSITAAGVLVNSTENADLKSITTNPFAGFAQILVSLESKHKADDRLGPSIVLTADLPGIVRTPPVPVTTSRAAN